MGPEPPDIHASVEHLSAFLERRLAAAERQVLVEHLADCGDGRYELAQASRLIASAPRPRRRALYVTLAIAAGVTAVMLGRSPKVMTDPPSEERSQRVVEPDVVTPIAVVAPTDGSEVRTEPIVLTWRPDAPGA